jgi:hypothetical protein
LNVKVSDGAILVALDLELIYTSITSNTGVEITSNAGDIIIVGDVTYTAKSLLNVENLCTPSAPFYIRWINRMGGWEFWMFQHRQTFENTLQKVTTFYADAWDLKSGSPVSGEVLTMEAQDTVTVGAEGLTSEEFNVLRYLIYSPHVELYDKDENEWSRIYCEKGKATENTRQASQSIEINFILPRVKMQKL